MTLRLHVPQATALPEDAALELPEEATRHVQVRRLQPGDALRLFDGAGGERAATVATMGRRSVAVTLGGALAPPAEELPVQAWLACAMPANERADWLVEKATELGVAGIQPLMAERSVVRLAGERADKRRAHWQAVAAAAAGQCGRAVVPKIEALRPMRDWLAEPQAADARWLLSPRAEDRAALPAARPRQAWLGQQPGPSVWALSGPEGGLSAEEQAAATHAGWAGLRLGARILRAETAPVAWLAWLAAECDAMALEDGPRSP